MCFMYFLFDIIKKIPLGPPMKEETGLVKEKDKRMSLALLLIKPC